MKTKYNIDQEVIVFKSNYVKKFFIQEINADGKRIEYKGRCAVREPDGTWANYNSSFTFTEEEITKFESQYTPDFIIKQFNIVIRSATILFANEEEAVLDKRLEDLVKILLQDPDEDGLPTDGECVDQAVAYINNLREK